MSAPQIVWIVQAGDPQILGELAEKLGDLAAVSEGRIFVDRARTTAAATPLALGSTIQIYGSGQSSAQVKLLGRQHGLLGVYKPPGIASEPDQHGVKGSLIEQVAVRLGYAMQALHVLNRLDLGVSGVVVVALERRARQFAVNARDNGEFRRRYVGIADGRCEPEFGVWNEPIGRAGLKRKVHGKNAEPAETRFACIGQTQNARGDAFSLLAFEPQTGRTHQLRIHAAEHGVPLLGDRAYGGQSRLTNERGSVLELERIALHASWVDISGVRFNAEIPADFCEYWKSVGGAESALQAAPSDEISGFRHATAVPP